MNIEMLVYCPWCHKPCFSVDLTDTYDGQFNRIFCEHCGELFKYEVHIDIDISTTKITAYEPGTKVFIDYNRTDTGCIIRKDEERGTYLVFVDKIREQEWIEPIRLLKAQGLWSHPDQLWIPFQSINNGGALCLKQAQ